MDHYLSIRYKQLMVRIIDNDKFEIKHNMIGDLNLSGRNMKENLKEMHEKIDKSYRISFKDHEYHLYEIISKSNLSQLILTEEENGKLQHYLNTTQEQLISNLKGYSYVKINGFLNCYFCSISSYQGIPDHEIPREDWLVSSHSRV
jgi:hypothetical protein